MATSSIRLAALAGLAAVVGACGQSDDTGYFLDVSSEVGAVDQLRVTATGPGGPLVRDRLLPESGSVDLPVRVRVEDGGRNETVQFVVWGVRDGAPVGVGEGSLAVTPGGEGSVAIVLRAAPMAPTCAERNLVLNPGLEGGDAGWEVVGGSMEWATVARTGKRALRACATAAGDLEIGTDVDNAAPIGLGVHALALWMKSETTTALSAQAFLRVRAKIGGGFENYPGPTSSVGTDWVQLAASTTLDEANNGLSVRAKIEGARAGDCVLVDDACLEAPMP